MQCPRIQQEDLGGTNCSHKKGHSTIFGGLVVEKKDKLHYEKNFVNMYSQFPLKCLFCMLHGHIDMF